MKNGSVQSLIGACTFTGLQQRDVHVIVFTKPLFSPIHMSTAKRRFQNFSLSKRYAFGDRFQWIRVDGRPNRRKKSPFLSKTNTCRLSVPFLYKTTLSPLAKNGHFWRKVSDVRTACGVVIIRDNEINTTLNPVSSGHLPSPDTWIISLDYSKNDLY